MKNRFLCLLAVISGLLALQSPQVFAQGTPTPTITALTTSFSYPNAQAVTPTFKFGHTIGGDPLKGPASARLTVQYIISPDPPTGSRVTLLEDNVAVTAPMPVPSNYQGSLTYVPSSPGPRSLTVVLTPGDGSAKVTSDPVVVQMFGTKLQTGLGIGALTPIIPFTSRIFLEADSLVGDANIKEAHFLHRSLPFQLSSGVPYTPSDKVVSNGKLFAPKVALMYAPGTTPPNVDTADPSTTSNNPNYRYIGPRLVSNVDYCSYEESTDPDVVLPPVYPAPPPSGTDLVISRDSSGNDNVYEVTTAGRLDPAKPVPTLAAGTAAADGIVQFTFAGNALLSNHTYRAGDLVVSNGRIYEVVQPGKTPAQLGSGLQQTDGEVTTLGTAGFNFIPSKVLKEQLPYSTGDLVTSNNRVYRVTIGGTIVAGGLGTGLNSTGANMPETKKGIVIFEEVGAPFDASDSYFAGATVTSNGRIYKVIGPQNGSATTTNPPPSNDTDPYDTSAQFTSNPNFAFELVIPQFHKYTEIDSDYAGVPLEQNVVYHAGDFVVSNNKTYGVTVGGTMGPVGGGLTSTGTQSLGGLTFRYVGPFQKEISTIHPFPDVPFPYSSFDYSFPYTLKWSPADTIANQYSWFGPSGYFEDHTNIELLTRTTDSKDRTNNSMTVPVSVIPPIDARAAISVNITSPQPGSLVAAGNATQITAEARDVNGVVRTVNSVQFFVDGVPLYAPDATFPYTTEAPIQWTPTVAGTYILDAVAIDDKGNYTISPDLRVDVTDDQPFIRLTSPDAGDPFDPMILGSGQSVVIAGVENGSGGDPAHISTVEFFSDGNSIGSVTPAKDGTFTFTYVAANAGGGPTSYQITARATDANGATANSNSIYLQVITGGASPSPTPIAVPLVQFTQNTFTASATAAAASLAVSLQRPTGDSAPVSVSYTTRDGTALAGRDYSATTGTVTFASGQTNQTITIPLISQPTSMGRSFSVTLSNPSRGTVGVIPTAFVTLTNFDFSTKLRNISTRASVESGQNVMIAGFIVSGDGTKQIVIRGLGPSLTQLGVIGAVSDPNLSLVNANGVVIAYDDNFGDDSAADQTTLSDNKLTPANANEAAIVAGLAKGRYTAILRSTTNGVGLIEIYDIGGTSLSSLSNISTRAKIEPGDNGALIGGFNVSAPSGHPGTAQRVLIRALGPSLSTYGVAGAVADPTLDLYRGSTLILSNDNWTTDDEAGIQATGLAPSDAKESAILATLDPGSYTAVVRGKNNTTGIALVEVYQMP